MLPDAPPARPDAPAGVPPDARPPARPPAAPALSVGPLRKDGFTNSQVERFILTRFGPLWRFAQRWPWLERLVNRVLINRAVNRCPARPNALSLMADYPSWDSLTDRTFSGRHLPPATDAFINCLPPEQDVAALFARPAGGARLSAKSSVLFSNFAQWFTDGFLRTARLPDGQPDFQRNTSNHEIDLSPVYGRTREMAHALRAHDGTGRLRSQHIPARKLEDGTLEPGGEFPAYFYTDEFVAGRTDAPVIRAEFDNPVVRDELYLVAFERMLLSPTLPGGTPKTPERRAADLDRMRHRFAVGVERANNQIGYVMLNVIFLREHNRLCDLLKAAHPRWGDEQLYQTARNTVIVMALRVVIEDYINHISPFHFKLRAQPQSFYDSKWYRTNWMTVEFNLLYRWHGLVPDAVDVAGTSVDLEQSLYNNGLLVRHGLAAAIDSASRQYAGEVGLANTPAYLVPRVELPSIRIARQARLRSYNDYREYAGYDRAKSFAEITSDPARQAALRALYGDPDNVEYFVGLFAEDPPANAALPPLIGRLVGVDAFSQAFTNPLLSEHVFEPGTFAEGWAEFQKTRTLDDVVRRNIPETTDARKGKDPKQNWPLVTLTHPDWTRQ